MNKINHNMFYQPGYIFLLVFLSLLFSLILFGENPGDINDDGMVDKLDTELLRDYFLERIVLDAEQLLRADANLDEKVDMADLVYLPSIYWGEIVLNLPDDVQMELIRIFPGNFIMGSPEDEPNRSDAEGPQRTVNINYDFYLGKFTVTKAQWEAVMDTRPWEGKNFVYDQPDTPATHVSWYDIRHFNGFLDTLNAHLANTEQPYIVRLPSEAEWEYSARAGTDTAFYWGDDIGYTLIDDYAWYIVNTWLVGYQYAHIVGQKPPNPRGLYDMAGNVWEWCEDDWHINYEGAPSDGSAWVDSPRGSYRIFRGGSFASGNAQCRSALRGDTTPGERDFRKGFRLLAVKQE